MKWTQAARARKMNPSAIREILKVTERPGIISFAGGLPSPRAFPVAEVAAACEKVLRDDGAAALQYAASEGFGPLRERIAASLPWPVDAAQVLITTGSQQGLDLVAKVLLDAESKLLVETPTYLGALQAFAAMEPRFVDAACDEEGVLPDALDPIAPGARFIYLLPNFQNPTGRTMGEARRAVLSRRCARLGLPIVEDNPYGDLWFDAAPPLPLAARNPEGCIYLGSLSKVLAPGLRLGFLVAPRELYPKLLQAKQAADLHSPILNQRIAYEVLRQEGFMQRHLDAVRALYRGQRDAMLGALAREMPEGVRWNAPAGGMFIWLRLPEGRDAGALLSAAVERGVAFVPGAPFYAHEADSRTLRLSFVTAGSAQIDAGIALLAAAIGAAPGQPLEQRSA